MCDDIKIQIKLIIMQSIGKTLIITGANRGLGLTLAKKLCSDAQHKVF